MIREILCWSLPAAAGPLHAVAIARELYIPTVIVPRFPAHFSALGMLMADERHDFIRTYYSELQDADFPALKTIDEDMAAESKRLLTPGVSVSHQILSRPSLRGAGIHIARAGNASSRLMLAIIARSAIVSMRCTSSATPIIRRKSPSRSSTCGWSRWAAARSCRCRRCRKAAKWNRERRRPVYSRSGRPADRVSGVQRAIDGRPAPRFKGPALVSEYGSTTMLFPGDRLAVADTRRTRDFGEEEDNGRND